MNEAPSEGRNLVLCFDGTNYEFDREPTNVVRLIEVLDRDRSKGQRLYYDPGVGTLPAPGALGEMLKTLTRWFGLAFDLGLSRKIVQAYTYLIDFWEPNDRVFMFGFSRGAYTASLSRLSPPARSPSSRQLQFDSVRDEIFSSHHRNTGPSIYRGRF
jgi:uncharacterized protein (DUF2235 family)